MRWVWSDKRKKRSEMGVNNVNGITSAIKTNQARWKRGGGNRTEKSRRKNPYKRALLALLLSITQPYPLLSLSLSQPSGWEASAWIRNTCFRAAIATVTHRRIHGSIRRTSSIAFVSSATSPSPTPFLIGYKIYQRTRHHPYRKSPFY